ncbi:MAG: hypothetical protein Q4D02_01925 [Clostridia bacterium]|nr:hypothetical protein [Clostridia bacterium]
MPCKHLRLRSYRKQRYFYCCKKHKNVSKIDCNNCNEKEYKKVKKMKNRTSRRAKACDISTRVKALVWQRDDGRCIICGQRGLPNSHYIKRSHGGLGIEENIVCMCISCHNFYDNGNDEILKNSIKKKTRDYLKRQYKNWKEENLFYKKEID